MNLELLRELATVDPETLDTYKIYGPTHVGTGFSLDEDTHLYNVNGVWTGEQGYDIEDFGKDLFWVLLDRIQARGWFYNLKNYHPGIEPTSGRAIVYTQGDNGIHKSDAENLVEALAHAYVQACKS